MRSYKKPDRKQKLITILCIMGLVVILMIGLLRLNPQKNSSQDIADNTNQTGQSKIDLSPHPDEERNAGDLQKKKFDSQDNSSTPITEKVVIKSIEKSGDNQIVIKTELYGNSWISCSLIATKDGNTIKKEAEVLYQPTYSSCMGFAISTNEFATSGNWKFTLTATKSDGSTLNTENNFNVTK